MKIYFINDLHWDFWKKQKYSLEKFFDEFFLPADTCCIAGDIGNDYEHSIEIMKYLNGKYAHVVYTMGNHDLGIFKKDRYKLNLQKTIDKKLAFQRIMSNQLDGTVLKIDNVSFGGSCGTCDWSWSFKNFETSDEDFLIRWQNWFDCKWWRVDSSSPWVILDWEMKKLQHVSSLKPKVFVTHFQPLSCPTPEMFNKDIMTGLFIFDDSTLNLQPGTIYHFGHTHSKLKLEQNGILYLNNCVGYPEELCINALGKFNKEDFLLDI